jgi:hypothetical protein
MRKLIITFAEEGGSGAVKGVEIEDSELLIP